MLIDRYNKAKVYSQQKAPEYSVWGEDVEVIDLPLSEDEVVALYALKRKMGLGDV